MTTYNEGSNAVNAYDSNDNGTNSHDYLSNYIRRNSTNDGETIKVNHYVNKKRPETNYIGNDLAHSKADVTSEAPPFDNINSNAIDTKTNSAETKSSNMDSKSHSENGINPPEPPKTAFMCFCKEAKSLNSWKVCCVISRKSRSCTVF